MICKEAELNRLKTHIIVVCMRILKFVFEPAFAFGLTSNEDDGYWKRRLEGAIQPYYT